MSPLYNAKEGSKKYYPIGGKNGGIPAYNGDLQFHNLRHLSREAEDLLLRLNELAKGYPFNIIYKVKEYDTH